MTPNTIYLRPFTPEDAPKLFLMSQEKELGQFLPDQVYQDLNEAHEVLNYLIACYTPAMNPQEAPYVLGVVHQESQALIGHVGLSAVDRGIEIGYAIEKNHTGKGYATLAIALMIEQAQQHTSLKKIYGVVDQVNAASIKVLEKCHFTPVETTETKQIYERSLSC